MFVAAVVWVAVVVVVIHSAGGRGSRQVPHAPLSVQTRLEATPSALALRTWPRKVPVGGPMFWEGAVLGSSSAQLLLAQVKQGESWETFETVPVSASGHYCLEYHFLRATHPTTYTFRSYFPGAASRHTGAVESNEEQVVVGEGARLRPRALAARLRHMRAYCPRTTKPAASD